MVFIPDKQVCMEMLIAKVGTKTNAQLTIDGIKEAVDYIVSAIAQMK